MGNTLGLYGCACSEGVALEFPDELSCAEQHYELKGSYMTSLRDSQNWEASPSVCFTLPYQIVPTGTEQQKWKVQICVAHGGLIGDPDDELNCPAQRHYYNDKWVRMTHWACSQNKVRALWYTARGYGNSGGWQPYAQNHLEQFGWAAQGRDLAKISSSNAAGRSGYISIGNSTGAAAALHAAFPTAGSGSCTRTKGLILMRLPGAYEHGAARQERLLAKLHVMEAAEIKDGAAVLRGAIASELPPLNRLQEGDFKVMILCVTDCVYHPQETSEQVYESLTRLNQTRTTIHRHSTSQAQEEWPGLISNFVKEVLRETAFLK